MGVEQQQRKWGALWGCSTRAMGPGTVNIFPQTQSSGLHQKLRLDTIIIIVQWKGPQPFELGTWVEKKHDCERHAFLQGSEQAKFLQVE